MAQQKGGGHYIGVKEQLSSGVSEGCSPKRGAILWAKLSRICPLAMNWEQVFHLRREFIKAGAIRVPGAAKKTKKKGSKTSVLDP